MLEQELIDAAKRFGMHIHRGMLRAKSNGLDWSTKDNHVHNLHGIYFREDGEVGDSHSSPTFYSIAEAIAWAIPQLHELKALGVRGMVFPYLRNDNGIKLEVAIYMNGKRTVFADSDGVFEAFLRGEIPHEVVFDWLTDNNHLAKQ